ncbi:aftiphilin a isoform X2 [Brachyhypopomus gauderio]|uniref:aftiphilin a isoform X2 n=1 Tax=Brachyhypopomus gauderio TaxID=698409 RepID=UPI004041EAC6
MEPDVVRLYSSSPPPMEDGGGDDDEDEFSDFTGVPNSISFTEFDTPTTFDQLRALNATSPPELMGNGRAAGYGPAKPNGSVAGNGRGDGAPCRTVTMEELKKTTECPRRAYTNFPSISADAWTGGDVVDCNGGVGGSETLTNGFVTFDTEGTSPSCQKHREAGPTVDRHSDPATDDDDFADFSAFSEADFPGHFEQGSGGGAERENSNPKDRLTHGVNQPPCEGELADGVAGAVVDDDEDTCVTGFASLASAADASGCLSNGDWGFPAGAGHEQKDLEADNSHHNYNTAEAVGTETLAVAQNGLEVQEKVDSRASLVLEEERGRGGEPMDGRGSGNDTETETETETSFGRPLSTDALEEFGDFSTTGSVPSPPLQEDTATPADHSQLAEDDDEDFGDFGDFGNAGCLGGAGFADFDQQGAAVHVAPSESAFQANPGTERANQDEFGDFDAHNDPSHAEQDIDDGTTFAGFPVSDSFADFSSAPLDCEAGAEGEWQAFCETSPGQGPGGSWAAFGQDPGSTFPQKSQDDWHESQANLSPPADGTEDCTKNSLMASLVSRLERLFLTSFPDASVQQAGGVVLPLRAFLEPPGPAQDGDSTAPAAGALQDVWRQLQDIHNAFGLRYQWGGSHSNKTLLCSLGIDTRNILFTGQKKQPVIVPMYAASLGMLEPTKEPVKPVSAAEMIASIAQSPTIAMEMATTDVVQESLPPVQFDWSSSGLTNPLDGVDPELYELTQVKLEVSGGGSRVADAFARLMSTVEKTNTSTRRARVCKEENLSEEARRVIGGLPDLSFMQAKVLMFPSTLTPLPLSSSSSPVPE